MLNIHTAINKTFEHGEKVFIFLKKIRKELYPTKIFNCRDHLDRNRKVGFNDEQ